MADDAEEERPVIADEGTAAGAPSIPNPGAADFRSRVIRVGAAAALALVWALLACWQYSDLIGRISPHDDSYIGYRYAANLARGQGLVFNAGERVSGASSLLYAALLAGCYAAGLRDLETVGAAIGLLSGAATVFACSLAVRQIAGRWLLALPALLPVLVSGTLAGWAVSGMETVFYTALVTGCFACYLAGAHRWALPLMACAVLTRPEGLIVPAGIAAAELLMGDRRLGLRAAAVGLVAFATYCGFNLVYYGSVVPNSLAMKSMSIAYSHPVGAQIRDIGAFFGRYYALPVLAAVAAAPLAFKGPQRSRLAGLLLVLAVSFVAFVFGPASEFQRYVTYALPLLALANVGATALLFRTAGRRAYPWIAALTLAACLQAGRNALDTRAHFTRNAAHQAVRREMGLWIAQNTPADALILSSDLGAISYFAAGHRFVDASGLVTPEATRALRTGSWDGFLTDLQLRRPAVVADTFKPSGELQALWILRRPWEFFRTPQPGAERTLPAKVAPIVAISSPPFYFGIASLDWEPLRAGADR